MKDKEKEKADVTNEENPGQGGTNPSGSGGTGGGGTGGGGTGGGGS